MSDNPDQQPTQPDSKTIWMDRLAFVLAEAKAVSLATWTFLSTLVGCVVTWFKAWRSPPEAKLPGPDWSSVIPQEANNRFRAALGCGLLALIVYMGLPRSSATHSQPRVDTPTVAGVVTQPAVIDEISTDAHGGPIQEATVSAFQRRFSMYRKVLGEAIRDNLTAEKAEQAVTTRVVEDFLAKVNADAPEKGAVTERAAEAYLIAEMSGHRFDFFSDELKREYLRNLEAGFRSFEERMAKQQAFDAKMAQKQLVVGQPQPAQADHPLSIFRVAKPIGDRSLHEMPKGWIAVNKSSYSALNRMKPSPFEAAVTMWRLWDKKEPGPNGYERYIWKDGTHLIMVSYKAEQFHSAVIDGDLAALSDDHLAKWEAHMTAGMIIQPVVNPIKQRDPNADKLVPESTTASAFVQRMKDYAPAFFVGDRPYSAVYEDGVFRKLFGPPKSDQAFVENKRLWTYRVKDGALVLEVSDLGDTVIVHNMDIHRR